MRGFNSVSKTPLSLTIATPGTRKANRVVTMGYRVFIIKGKDRLARLHV